MDIDGILKMLEKNVKYGEIRILRYNTTEFVMKNGVLSGVGTIQEEGIAIRALNNTFSFVTSENMSDENTKRLVEKAIKFSKSQGKSVKLSEEEIIKDNYNLVERKKILDLSIEEKISYLNDFEKILVKENTPMRLQFLRDKITEMEFYNTEGTSRISRIPNVSYRYMIGVMENGNFEQASQEFGMSGGYEAFDEWNLWEKLEKEVKTLKEIAKSKKSPEGKMDLIVGPEVSGIVAHESAGHPSEADRILGREAAQAGESFIKPEMIGERIGSDVVNVVDDPTIEKSFGHYKYDYEGVRARKRYLYKNGKINEFLMNRETAGYLGKKSNAAARSSWWDMEPIVRMSTTYIEPGDYTFDELIEDIKYGIFMNSFTEWNIDDIRFNEKYIGREAYLIENGKITVPVKRPVLEITTKGFYSAVDALSKDLIFFAGTCGKGDPMQGVDVWMGGPYVRLRNVYLR
mgnify:CR=1 FL=1